MKSDDSEVPRAGDSGGFGQLADLSRDTILDEKALAKIVGRHRASVKRAVERGELPRPVKLFGKPSWTVSALLDHIANRLSVAARTSE
jgi:predicted DNA-binding transcriptional regulator AlpA